MWQWSWVLSKHKQMQRLCYLLITWNRKRTQLWLNWSFQRSAKNGYTIRSMRTVLRAKRKADDRRKWVALAQRNSSRNDEKIVYKIACWLTYGLGKHTCMKVCMFIWRKRETTETQNISSWSGRKWMQEWRKK